MGPKTRLEISKFIYENLANLEENERKRQNRQNVIGIMLVRNIF
jgi:hypothetical protein